MMSRKNSSRVALVTGSSTGIGAAVALKLASYGFNLILHGRSKSQNLKSTQKAVEALSAESRVVVADFSNTANLAWFVEECWTQFGIIDVVVNNAGGDVLTGDWSERDFESKLQYLLKVDVTATLVLSRMFGRRMHEQSLEVEHSAGWFSIINMGWDQAYQGMSGDSGEMFATTKGAIMSMTKSLAQSMAPRIRVNCIAPGWIQTQWGEQASEKWRRRATGDALMNRWGTPQDVANLAAFLASDDSSFITGQVIPVNGGFRYGVS